MAARDREILMDSDQDSDSTISAGATTPENWSGVAHAHHSLIDEIPIRNTTVPTSIAKGIRL